MNRVAILKKFKKENYKLDEPWDVLVIGGGATGLGIALDASLRGLKTVLLERGDLAAETSSNSTKLSHGGVRYLKTLEFRKILESSHEQLVMKTIAPHLVNDVQFVLPAKNLLQLLFYRLGFFLFDFLSSRVTFLGERNLTRAKIIAKAELEKKLPLLETSLHKFGIEYRDCQFDDARFALNIAEKAEDSGAIILNYFNVDSLLKENGRIKGVFATDQESNENYSIRAKVVINAAGPFSDLVLKKDDRNNLDVIKPLKGIHIVLPRKFLAAETALVIPETSRKRVFYVIPWLGRVLVGTTETEVDSAEQERFAKVVNQEDVRYLLEEFSKHFKSKPVQADILGVFAGVRPIVRNLKGRANGFASREHSIFISDSGLITIAGGKWTTYRKMAEDVVDFAMINADFIKLPSRTLGVTFALAEQVASAPEHLRHFGRHAKEIRKLEEIRPELALLVDPRLPLRWSGVYWAFQRECAVHLDDVLIRRSRCLALDLTATSEVAPLVAEFVASELGKDKVWVEREVLRFEKVVARYRG